MKREKGGGKLKKTLRERMEEFCTYHRDGDGECNAILLREYADAHGLTAKDRFDLAYFFSITYCCESGVILFLNRGMDLYALKGDMIFQSDRKYVRMKDYFERLIYQWQNSFSHYDTTEWFENGVLSLEKAIKGVEKWYMFGRFSAFLFLETYATLMNAPVTNTTIDWEHGDTATSGLLNLFGHDEFATDFDRKGILQVPVDKMDGYLRKTAENVKLSGGDPNTTKIETSLCAYRKFYKGTRYNGYYLDRMLEELVWYQRERPQYIRVTEELYNIRKTVFDSDMLGELHGWDGIRKENKKLYMLYGII